MWTRRRSFSPRQCWEAALCALSSHLYVIPAAHLPSIEMLLFEDPWKVNNEWENRDFEIQQLQSWPVGEVELRKWMTLFGIWTRWPRVKLEADPVVHQWWPTGKCGDRSRDSGKDLGEMERQFQRLINTACGPSNNWSGSFCYACPLQVRVGASHTYKAHAHTSISVPLHHAIPITVMRTTKFSHEDVCWALILLLSKQLRDENNPELLTRQLLVLVPLRSTLVGEVVSQLQGKRECQNVRVIHSHVTFPVPTGVHWCQSWPTTKQSKSWTSLWFTCLRKQRHKLSMLQIVRYKSEKSQYFFHFCVLLEPRGRKKLFLCEEKTKSCQTNKTNQSCSSTEPRKCALFTFWEKSQQTAKDKQKNWWDSLQLLSKRGFPHGSQVTWKHSTPPRLGSSTTGLKHSW